MAAARKVSAAQSSTERPSARYRFASFPIVVVFPAPFTPTTMTTAGGSATRAMGLSAACRISSRCSRIRPANLTRIGQRMTVGALANQVQNFLRGVDADIGPDQRVFEFVEEIGINFLLTLERIFQAVDQAEAGFGNAGFQLFEQRGLLLNGAEQRLNHLNLSLSRASSAARRT